MSWEKALKTELAKCKVAMCSARDCIWNERGQCSKEYISIGAKGDCSDYKTTYAGTTKRKDMK